MRRIVILGGGVGGLSCALELTGREGYGKRFSVEVLQRGWLLGGKAASTRNPARSLRIEEHGIHLWFGCYTNAFSMIRTVYKALGEDWRAAFVPHDTVTLEEYGPDGQPTSWDIRLPTNDRPPGTVPIPNSPLGYIPLLCRFACVVGADALSASGTASQRVAPPIFTALEAVAAAAGSAVAGACTRPAGMRALSAAVGAFQQAVKLARRPFMAQSDPRLLRAWTVLDLVAAMARGMTMDGVFERGFDHLDAWDMRGWLARHGAHAQTLKSGMVRAGYDAAFSYRDGDSAMPIGAAGSGLRAFCRMFLTYGGAVFWKMTQGMGEAVVAPMYRLLQQRGVRFRFFHDVKALHVGADGDHIESVSVERTAQPRGEYDPLLIQNGLWCWPDRPDLDQLASQHTEPVVLRAGVDYDDLVLAISVAALPPMTRELAARDPRWKQMLEHMGTVPTQAAQLWFDGDGAELGWERPGRVLTGCVEPFGSVADLSHLLAEEDWPTERAPGHLVYVCGAMAPGGTDADVERTTRAWLVRNGGRLWPSAGDSPRLIDTYFRANQDPSDQYVLSVPGSTRYRLAADGAGVSNLFLAGDWVRTGLNAGCIEAAVMSGRQAARALLGGHYPIPGESDF